MTGTPGLRLPELSDLTRTCAAGVGAHMCKLGACFSNPAVLSSWIKNAWVLKDLCVTIRHRDDILVQRVCLHFVRDAEEFELLSHHQQLVNSTKQGKLVQRIYIHCDHLYCSKSVEQELALSYQPSL